MITLLKLVHYAEVIDFLKQYKLVQAKTFKNVHERKRK